MFTNMPRDTFTQLVKYVDRPGTNYYKGFVKGSEAVDGIYLDALATMGAPITTLAKKIETMVSCW